MKNKFRWSRPVVIKVQTVRTIPIHPDPNGNDTIGMIVDRWLAETQNNEESPNKMVIDLDPRDDDYRCE